MFGCSRELKVLLLQMIRGKESARTAFRSTKKHVPLHNLRQQQQQQQQRQQKRAKKKSKKKESKTDGSIPLCRNALDDGVDTSRSERARKRKRKKTGGRGCSRPRLLVSFHLKKTRFKGISCPAAQTHTRSNPSKDAVKRGPIRSRAYSLALYVYSGLT